MTERNRTRFLMFGSGGTAFYTASRISARAAVIGVGKSGQNDRYQGAGSGNLLTTAMLVTEAALMRKESRGGHVRSDFPKTRRKRQGRHISW